MIEQLEKQILTLLEQRNGLLDVLQTQNNFKIRNHKEILTFLPLQEKTLKEIVANYYVNLLLISKKTRQAEKVAESEHYLAYQDKEDSPGQEDYYKEIIEDIKNMIESLKQLCSERELLII